MPLPEIPYLNAISLREEVQTDGNSPIKVVAEDYLMYLVKNSKNKNPATDIINELLCFYFLHAWNIPVPDAALIKVNPTQLLDEYSSNHKPHYYKKVVFGSRWIDAIDCNTFISVSNKPEYKKYNNPEIIFQIGLFDIWVENDDRKPSNNNLLLQSIEGRQNMIPIDHAFIFGTVKYTDLDPSAFTPIENENIFITNLAKSLKSYKKSAENWLQRDQESFYLHVEKCKEIYSEIVATIPETWGFNVESQTSLHNFLFNNERNKKVFDEYVYKMLQ